MKTHNTSIDTIAAPATASGRGGVGIIRISGPKTRLIAQQILGKLPKPRVAEFHYFHGENNIILDQGLALFFPTPNSFTGEDVLELHAHGGPVLMDLLLKTIINLGARLAKPGEFSERAFLNDKIDLTQAEAIADLIDAASEQAVRCAVRSLQGEFSERIETIVKDLIKLRMYVEAAIDFPEEEIDFLSDSHIHQGLTNIISNLEKLLNAAEQGAALREGLNLVIAGPPNAGKSSLLNALSGRESAIVTDIPGTTRDVLREQILIDGMPIHIIDTAGLRQSEDVIEQEGIRRAHQEIDRADQILLVIDKQKPEILKDFLLQFSHHKKLTVIYNKIDLTNESAEIIHENNITFVKLSAKQQQGLDLLRQHLKQIAGIHHVGEGSFLARRRHLMALQRALESVKLGHQQLKNTRAGELLAEDLRQAQQALGEITGEFTSDDLLGEIFSSFCIGK